MLRKRAFLIRHYLYLAKLSSASKTVLGHCGLDNQTETEDKAFSAQANLLTLSRTKNFRLFQTERICRQQFWLCENGRKFSKRVENTAGKGEIARYEQFLLFPQCFQMTRKIKGLLGKG